MISLLTSIVNLFVCWVQTGATLAFNAVIVALAFIVTNTVGLLPDMPAYPSVPSWFTSAAGWVAWVFPVHQAVLVFAFLVTVWTVWYLVAAAMRWGKFL